MAARVAWIVSWFALLAAALFLIPIPYIIFGPGAAVDLNRAIIVPDHTPPPSHFYLTDVDLLPGRPAFYVAAKILPGFEIIRRRELIPPTMTDRDLDNILVDAMRESQTNAQIVAERAAGLKVLVSSSFVVIATLPRSPAAGCFQRGDKIMKVNGQALHDAGQLPAVTTAKPPGTRFTLMLTRNGHRLTVVCPTFRYKGKARFGVTGSFQTEAYSLPVHVQYKLPNINGSSAGLMFALQIYRTLKGVDLSGGRDVAGTGVLTAEGKVQPIEGAREKVRAAIKAHAEIFLVPKSNYADIRGTPGIRIIPISSFGEALNSLSNL
jgi:PDZ domain-containing protein